jgi:hypothetical protein
MTSGTDTVGGEFDVGRNASSYGNFKMTSGTLSVGGDAFIGYYGPGMFSIPCGSVSIKGNLSIADQASVTGMYSMTSGSLKVTGNEFVGNFGNATLNMTSGSNTANGPLGLTLAAQAGSTGTYNITSGSVSAPNGILINGSAGQGPGNNGLGHGTFNVLGSAEASDPVTNYGTVNVGTTTKNASVTWNNTFTNYNIYNAGNPTGKGTTSTFIQDLVVQSFGYIDAMTPTHPGPTVARPVLSGDKFIFNSNFYVNNTNT